MRKAQRGEHLTPREKQVLKLIAEGLSNKLIGVRLDITYHTVKMHVTNVCVKLGVDTRVMAAVFYALNRTTCPDCIERQRTVVLEPV